MEPAGAAQRRRPALDRRRAHVLAGRVDRGAEPGVPRADAVHPVAGRRLHAVDEGRAGQPRRLARRRHDVDRLQGRERRHGQRRHRRLRGRRPRLGRQRLRRLGRLGRLPHLAGVAARGEARRLQPADRRRRAATRTTASRPSTPASSTPVQVDRDAVRTTVFPWVAAGGAPGRVAVAFYGTTSDGDPNSGDFKAAWNVYVNQSLNALAATRDVQPGEGDDAPVPLRLDLPERARLRPRRAGGRPLARGLLRDRLQPGGRQAVRRLRPRRTRSRTRRSATSRRRWSSRRSAGPSNGGGTVAVAGARGRCDLVRRPDGRRAVELLAHGARRRAAAADEERGGGRLHERGGRARTRRPAAST